MSANKFAPSILYFIAILCAGKSSVPLLVVEHAWPLWRTLRIIIMHDILLLVQCVLESTQHLACSAYMYLKCMIRSFRQKLHVAMMWYVYPHFILNGNIKWCLLILPLLYNWFLVWYCFVLCFLEGEKSHLAFGGTVFLDSATCLY